MKRMMRALLLEELPVASRLIWRVFQRFEAPDYSSRGVEAFRKFILPANLRRMALSGESRFFGCFDGGRLVGVIADRGRDHVSLLFVDEDYHRQGIARGLFRLLWQENLLACPSLRRITVNASPYAVEAYRRLGFSPLSGEQERDGLRFWPMEFVIKKGKAAPWNQ